MTLQSLWSLRLPLAFVAALLLALQLLGGLDRLDNALGDALLRKQAMARVPPEDIVVIAIDQRSLEQLNDMAGSWPWPRIVHGELVQGLAAFQPAAIAFDIHFNEGDHFRADSDVAFREMAAAHAELLFFPSLLLSDGNRTRFDALPESYGAVPCEDAKPDAGAPLLLPLVVEPINWRGGLVNFERDADEISRHIRLWREIDGWRLPYFAARVAATGGFRLPDIERPRLHWYGSPPPSLSYADLFHDLEQREPKLAPSLKGKILLIGATTSGLHDMRPTPLDALRPGVEILATAIANLRQGDWLRDVPSRWALTAALLIGLAWAYARKAGAVAVGAGLLGVSLALVYGSYALLDFNRYAPVGAAVAAGWLAFAALTAQAQWREHRQRQATVAIFQRFLDPRVVDELVASEELSLDNKPVARDISILFSDIRGFTSLSETRTPEAVVELLNRYFTRQTDVIFRHGGTLDKFIGDAIMAFWNAPADLPDHARRAVTAALEMTAELDAFREELKKVEPDLGHFDIGIGIHTGPAVVGFLGSSARLDYTAIGDAVNLASRVESTTKGVGRVLVTEATRDACGADAPFDFEPRGQFHVKGREQPVNLYEPRPRQSATGHGN